MNTTFPTRVLLAAGLSMALQWPIASADEVKQGLLTQSQRQESVGRSMNNSISELEALMADLESNGMIEQDAGSRVGSLEAVLTKINQEHVPAASSAMRNAALSVDTRGQHLDKASTEVEQILGQLKTVLKDLGDEQRAAAYESILTGLINDNNELIEATKDWGEAQVLNPEQADDLKKDVSELQSDVDKGVESLTDMIREDLAADPDSPLADRLEDVVKAITGEEPEPPAEPEVKPAAPEDTATPPETAEAPEPPQAEDAPEMADAPEPGEVPDAPEGGDMPEAPETAEGGDMPETPESDEGGQPEATEMAEGAEQPTTPEASDSGTPEQMDDAMAGVESNNPEAALTSQIETGNKLMEALKALNPDAAAGMDPMTPPPGAEGAAPPPTGEMAGGEMPPEHGRPRRADGHEQPAGPRRDAAHGCGHGAGRDGPQPVRRCRRSPAAVRR